MKKLLITFSLLTALQATASEQKPEVAQKRGNKHKYYLAGGVIIAIGAFIACQSDNMKKTIGDGALRVLKSAKTLVTPRTWMRDLPHSPLDRDSSSSHNIRKSSTTENHPPLPQQNTQELQSDEIIQDEYGHLFRINTSTDTPDEHGLIQPTWTPRPFDPEAKRYWIDTAPPSRPPPPQQEKQNPRIQEILVKGKSGETYQCLVELDKEGYMTPTAIIKAYVTRDPAMRNYTGRIGLVICGKESVGRTSENIITGTRLHKDELSYFLFTARYH